MKSKFKFRNLLSPKIFKLVWGDCGIFFYQQGRFEFSYYLFLKKLIKKLIKKATYTYNTRKYWLFIRPNLLLSKKSKNSRMGKGKGDPTRWAFRSKIYSPLIEFVGINYTIIRKIKNFLQTKIRVRLVFIRKQGLDYQNVGKKNLSFNLFQKYNCL